MTFGELLAALCLICDSFPFQSWNRSQKLVILNRTAILVEFTVQVRDAVAFVIGQEVRFVSWKGA